MKLNINLLPRGAWGNDLSNTLPKKEWDILRNYCYKRANNHCEICGKYDENLNAHEEWIFDKNTKIQTLTKIIGVCSNCHGVIHFRNSERNGYGDNAKKHFMKINNCNQLEFAKHYFLEQNRFDELSKIKRWKVVADLSKFGGEGIGLKQRILPYIINPYKNIEILLGNYNELFEVVRNIECKSEFILEPRVRDIEIDNYAGTISIKANFANKIDWFLDGKKIKTKYNSPWKFIFCICVENLNGKKLNFIITGKGGYIKSKDFILTSEEKYIL